jgi:hypothetical protein
MNAFFDRHHLLYYDKQWSALPETSRLRSEPRNNVLMQRFGHTILHREVCFVPVLSPHMAKSVLNELRAYPDNENPLINLDNLQSSINYAKTYPRTTEIEKRVAELAIYALDLQKPFIKDYWASEDKIGHPHSPDWNRKYGQ